jgi:CRP-like cAMP-binding protein
MKADLDRFAPAAGGGTLAFGGINLSKDESTLLIKHLGGVQSHRANVRLIAEDEPLDRPRLLRSGWACRVRYLRDGRRQILNYYLPGDVIGISAEQDATALASYVSLTRVTTMDVSDLRNLVFNRPGDSPTLVTAWQRLRQLEECQVLAQVTRIGRQKACERVAHLLLEIHGRLERAGLAEGYTFQLPLTQEALADGLGLSAVHVNRTFKQLKLKNYLRIERTSVSLLEPKLLAEISDYHEMPEAAFESFPVMIQTDSRRASLGNVMPA